jgi:predicted permease
MLNRLLSRLRTLVGRHARNTDLDDELRAFYEASVEAKLATGMPREQAERAARIELGSPAAVKEWVGDGTLGTRLESVWQDVRHAGRALRRDPWYASTVVVVLAVGMALATVAFAVVDGVLFKPLPLSRPSELFVIRASATLEPGSVAPPVSFREIEAWRQAVPELSLSGVSAAPDAVVLAPGREIWTAAVDERFFEVIGRQPLVGGFSEDDFAWNWARVDDGGTWQPQIISHRLWRHEYGGDPGIIGRTIISSARNSRTFGRRIVGILPPDFVFPIDEGGAEPDVLVPIFGGLQRSQERRFQAIVRIPSDAAVLQVEERLRAATQVPALNPAPLPHGDSVRPHARLDDVRLVGLVEHLAADERPAFTLVAAAAGLMLLLTCVNVAGLAASRNLYRRNDLAIRGALGASGWRIARGLLAEIAVLAFAATGLALLIARPMLIETIALLPSTLTLMKVPALDGRVFAAAALLSLLTVLGVSLWPLRMAARVKPSFGSSVVGGTSTGMGRRSRFVLIAAQVGLGFVLLAGGGLSMASFAAAWRTDAGFERARTFLIEAFVMRSLNPEDTRRQLESGADLLARLPGVEDVAVSSIQPLFARRSIAWSTVAPRGWPGPLENVATRNVSDNFFRLMGLHLVSGRWPAAGEWNGSRPVAVVSATAARRLWPGRDAVGQELVRYPAPRQPQPPVPVIGVVADARFGALDAEPIADIYLPGPITPATTGVYLHARTTGPAERMLPQAAAALTAAGLRLEQAATHEDAVFDALKHRALPAWLFGTLGLAALLVLGAGILGILAASAAQRTREMGIRIALGATPAAMVRLIVREQLAAIAAGLGAGAIVSAWAVRYVQSELYGTGPYDPVLWSAIALVVVAVGFAGTLVPARRAARVDPVVALRTE